MIPRFKSILGRIIWLHILVLGIAAIAVPTATFLLLKSTSEDLENRTLLLHANMIARYLAARPDGSLTLKLPSDLRTFYAHGFEGLAFAISEKPGETLFSSLPNVPLWLGAERRTDGPFYFQVSGDHASYFGVSIPVRYGNRLVWVQVIQNLEHPDVIFDNVIADFLRRIAWFTIPIILLALIVDIYVVRRALRPVIVASKEAQAIDPRRLELRLPTHRIPQEILPLIETINQALARLERGFRVQRNFTADAAHELRTPLSVLRIRIDRLTDQDSAGPLRSNVDAMTRIVNQLLDIAELEGMFVDSSDRVDLHRVCCEVASLMAPIAVSQGKDIALTGCDGAVWVKGNSAMLFQAIRNLAENAVRYTMQGTTVEVRVEAQGIIRVVDEGPGVPEGDREVIFQRFWRRDRARAGGAGLGLAIVARVAEAHLGSITVANREGGGAIFSLDLSNSHSQSTSSADETAESAGAADDLSTSPA